MRGRNRVGAMKIGGDSSRDALAYADARYAESLREFGSPVTLSRTGAMVLKRSIPGTGSYDAMGCYPLFSCRDWSLLHEDLRDLQASDIDSGDFVL